MSKPIYEQLSNGIRIVYQKVDSPVAHLGFYFGTGSRCEEPEKMGLVHFLEHSLFKGTKKRKAYHILSRIDSVGGELNAYTSKEELCLYASFTKKHFIRSLELLADISKNSTFPVKELMKEKEVVLDEINSYLDAPSDKIFDDFEKHFFGTHGLGYNILGTKDTIDSITPEDLKKHVKNYFCKDNLVISFVGNISLERVRKSIFLFLEDLPEKSVKTEIKLFNAYQRFELKENYSNYQTHCILGGLAPSYTHKHKLPMTFLINILGGPALNSILNLSIREKYGFTYTIEANYQPFFETGYWQIYFGCDPKNLNLSLDLIKKAITNICTKPFSDLQLHRYKEQLKGQIALSMDSNIGIMHGNAKAILMYNQIESIKDTFDAIDKIDAKELMEIAKTYFSVQEMSSLIYYC